MFNAKFVKNNFNDSKSALSFVKNVNKFDRAVQDSYWILVIRVLSAVKEKKDQDAFIKDVNSLASSVPLELTENRKAFLNLLKTKKLKPTKQLHY